MPPSAYHEPTPPQPRPSPLKRWGEKLAEYAARAVVALLFERLLRLVSS